MRDASLCRPGVFLPGLLPRPGLTTLLARLTGDARRARCLRHPFGHPYHPVTVECVAAMADSPVPGYILPVGDYLLIDKKRVRAAGKKGPGQAGSMMVENRVGSLVIPTVVEPLSTRANSASSIAGTS